jgi:hypothetical protein
VVTASCARYPRHGTDIADRFSPVLRGVANLNDDMRKNTKVSRDRVRQSGTQDQAPTPRPDRTVARLERRVREINNAVASLQKSQVLTKEVLQRKVSF